jgi:Putative transposase of IS4/5 family (DUF4096)
MATLIDDLVPDKLWTLVEPLLPVPPRPPYGGRHRVIPDRNCFAAIVYMARTSTPWRLLPARELGCGLASDVLASVDRVGQGRGVRCPSPQGLDQLCPQGAVQCGRDVVGDAGPQLPLAHTPTRPRLAATRVPAVRPRPRDGGPVASQPVSSSRTPARPGAGRPGWATPRSGQACAVAPLSRLAPTAPRAAERCAPPTLRRPAPRQATADLQGPGCWLDKRGSLGPGDGGAYRVGRVAAGGRSHSDAWVGCMVWSTTASSSAARVSRSVCWRSRALNASMVRAAL